MNTIKMPFDFEKKNPKRELKFPEFQELPKFPKFPDFENPKFSPIFGKEIKTDPTEAAKKGCLVRNNFFSTVCCNCHKSITVAYIKYKNIDLCLSCTENLLENEIPFKFYSQYE